ncbi:MAG: type II secretory pathway pullulanase PulA [Puniceicoccaceae bacterium 5H]|nr:MAG: type II secretory pathway pullulanase PulA [Puniceicoccaceae bacterium 5H]
MSRFLHLLAGLATLCTLTGRVLAATPVLDAQAPLHPAFADRVLYFLLTDRFANGDPANDTGTGSGPSAAAFDPASGTSYHGGDLEGVTQRLDYLQGLGVDGLWMTPIFTNKPIQGGSTGYHGYWITDFLGVDAHLGDGSALEALVAASHERGIGIYLDIVVNHTADVIQYEGGGSAAYRDKGAYPYRNAQGQIFDDRAISPGEAFPELNLASFPYVPTVSAGEIEVKNPAWLNDPIYYHNRGDSTFAGESSLYGDFYGLDDLFTEHPVVVDGMIDIYRWWIDQYGIDGYRIDTVKHVNGAFWERFGPAMQQAGGGDFFQFGEVYDGDARFSSEFVVRGGMPATLDFPLMFALRDYVTNDGSGAGAVATVYQADDWYRSAGTNPNVHPVFLSNHDVGRLGYELRQAFPNATDAELQRRMRLGYALLFFGRGQPVLYYGDEQGFTGGGGGDATYREDMLASQVSTQAGFDLIGTTATTADDNFDPAHPLYQSLARMAAVYHAHEALRAGAQQVLATGDDAVMALSRWQPEAEATEYLVVANNSTSVTKDLMLAVQSAPGTTFSILYDSNDMPPSGDGATVGPEGLALTLEPSQVCVLQADRALPHASGELAVAVPGLVSGGLVTASRIEKDGQRFGPRLHLQATLDHDAPAVVSFYGQRSSQPEQWQYLGSDDSAPYRLYPPLPADWGDDETLSLAVVAQDLTGRVRQTEVRDLRPAASLATTHLWVHVYGAVDAVTIAGAGSFPVEDMGALGRVALVPVADPTAMLALQLPGWSESRTVVPARSPHVWVSADRPRIYGQPLAAGGTVTLHYPGAVSQSLSIRQGGRELARLAPEGSDTYGRVFTLEAADLASDCLVGRVEAVLVDGPQEVSPAVAFDLGLGQEIWLQPAEAAAYLSAEAASGQAVLHYRRPAGDEKGWGLHLWTGAAHATTWAEPLLPAREDGFGAVFAVDLADGADTLAYILHRGDAKDPGADQALALDATGREAWQVQGADAAVPYIHHAGEAVLSFRHGLAWAGAEAEPEVVDGQARFFAPAGWHYELESRSLSGDWLPLLELEGDQAVHAVALPAGYATQATLLRVRVE